jgi:aldehyde:ferredoxin oxidoreductase
MGDKNLKAISVYGTKDLGIARPSEFNELSEYILKRTDRVKQYWYDFSEKHGKRLLEFGAYGNLGEMMPIENSSEFIEDFIKRFKTRLVSCYNCAVGCKSAISLPDDAYAFVKCGSWFSFLLACKIQDLTFSMKCYHLCEKYGLDAISTASILGFAIDLYEKGILTKADTGGLHLEWGNADVAFSLIGKISRREDIGAVLADGVYEAARQIGKGAGKHAYHIKKLEPFAYPVYAPYPALRSAISDRADVTRAEGYLVFAYLVAPREWKEEFINEGYFSYPKELEKLFLDDFIGLQADYDTIVPFTSADADKNNLADSTGICIFWTGMAAHNPINLDEHIRLLSYGTGMDFDETEAMTIAKKIGALTRAYNVMTGIRRKDDTVPEKFFRVIPEPPRPLLDRDKFDGMISKYYKLRGWNRDGIPSKKTLDMLDLQYVRKELERRRIL